MVYNSHLYDIRVGSRFDPNLQTDVYTQELVGAPMGGWRYSFQLVYLAYDEREPPPNVGWNCGTDGEAARRLYRLRIGLPDGSLHTLHLKDWAHVDGGGSAGDGFYAHAPSGVRSHCATQLPGTYPQNLTGTLTYYTEDGSFIKVEMQASGSGTLYALPVRVYLPDGSTITFEADGSRSITDGNGNRISLANICGQTCSDLRMEITDDAGRNITTHYNNTWPITDTVTGLAPQGGTAPVWTVTWGNVIAGSAMTGYECAPNLSCIFYQNLPNAVTSIGVPGTPNPLSYSFTYSSGTDKYGEISTANLPYGARAEYDWRNTYRALNNLLDNPLMARRLVHDGVTKTTGYVFTNTQSTITGPDGGVTKNYFDDITQLSNWKRGLIDKTEDPKGNVVQKTWAQNIPLGFTSGLLNNRKNPYVQKEIRSVANTAGTPVSSAISDYSYDKNGNLLSRTEYDWVPWQTTAGSSILRKTIQSYYVPVDNATTSPGANDLSAYWSPHNPSFWPVSTSPRRLNAVKRRELWQGSNIRAVSEFAYDSAYQNGNVTSEKRWHASLVGNPSPPGTPLTTSNSIDYTKDYDSKGNLTDIFGPGVRTRYVMDSNNLYPTEVQYGPSHDLRKHTLNHDFNSGLLSSITDQDNGFQVSHTYDPLGRRKTTNEGGLRRTEITYDDSARKITVKRDLRALDDGKLQTMTHFDQLGRPRLVRQSDGTALQTSGESDGIKTQISYPVFSGGSAEVRSSPYRATSEPTMGYTCTERDTAGRTVRVSFYGQSAAPTNCTTAANRTGTQTISYNGATTTSTDEAGKQRTLAMDALGRVIGVTEFTGYAPPKPASYSTSYTWDAFDNLTKVTQGIAPNAQERTFTYNSLSRLTSVQNPESGTTSYTYYDHGGLHIKTDAGSATTTHTYDTLQRLTGKTYSGVNTPNVSFSYHQPGASPQVGRLKLTSAGATPNLSSTELTWDALGRVTSNKQRITGNANDYILNYIYYLNDAINQLTYPSGRSVTYTLDDAGRDLELKQGTTRSLARIAKSPDPTGWSAHGAVTDIQLGNGLWEYHEFNSRLQKHRSRLGKVRAPAQPADTLLDMQLTFPGQNNNGNPSNQVIRTAGRAWTQNYGYDGVNRLTSASEIGDDYTNGFNETYNYDAFGNRWVTGTSPGTDNQQPGFESNYNPANNRFAGNPGPYDSVGNLTTFGPFTLAYDQEGHVVSANGGANGTASFAYDGDGRRVRKDFTINSSTTSTYYVYDAAGNLAAEYSNSLQSTSDTHFPFLDWLGTTRAVVDQGKGFVARYDYTPFGRLIASSSSPVFMLGRNAIPGYPTEPKSLGRQTHLFTGKERDREIGDAGLDYFDTRYFSSAQGRFTSPDVMMGKPEWLADPQRWNRYAYVRNNPLKYIDPDGEDLVVYYWDSQNLTEQQRQWLRENRQRVFDTIRDRFTKAGVQNVEFRSGSSLTADQTKQLLGRTGIGQLNFQNTTNVVGEQFGVATKGETLGKSGVGMGPSQIFLGNLSDETLFGLRIPGFGLLGSDLAIGAGEVGAHELGHRLGFDAVPGSMYRMRFDNLMTEGMGNPKPGRPLYFRPTKNDQRVIDEINRIGDNTPKRRE